MSSLFHEAIECCMKVCMVFYLSSFCVTVSIMLRLMKRINLFIDSIEHPSFVWSRKFVKKYLRMMFLNKTYKINGYDSEDVRRGDSYIDSMLDDMFENKAEEMDPYTLEDSSVGFHKKVTFMNVTGEAKMFDGYIKGLRTLHRSKHCSLQEEGSKLRVKADLGAGELEFHYKGTVKFMNFGPTITVTGTLSYIEIFMEFKVNSKTGRNGKLTKFAIDDMRGMKVKVSGLGPLNWAVNPIISGVTKIFKRFVRNFMEDKVEKHIREHLPNYQFPVEGSEITETTPIDETAEPETEVTEKTAEPQTEATDDLPEPQTEATDDLPELQTEATDDIPEPQTEATDDLPEPETEASDLIHDIEF